MGRRYAGIVSANALPKNNAVLIECRREIAAEIFGDEWRAIGVADAVDARIRSRKCDQSRADVLIAFDPFDDLMLHRDALIVCDFDLAKREVASENRIEQR